MQANDIPDIGSRRELFVDRLLVDRLEGARLKLQEPRSGGVAVQYDTAVEGYPDHPSSFYTTVFEDGGVYRMYYRGGSDSERSLTCYAESADGIVWRKPDLGIFEVDGSANHNVIGFVQAPQFCAFKDTRPDVPDSERYKANALRTTRADNVGLFAYVSADGVHWSKLREELIVPNVMRNHFDSQNVMFWSEVEQQYVLYARHMVGGKRGDRAGDFGKLPGLERADADDLQRHRLDDALGAPVHQPDQPLFPGRPTSTSRCPGESSSAAAPCRPKSGGGARRRSTPRPACPRTARTACC